MWKVEHHYSIQVTTGKAEFISIKREEPYCVITDTLNGDYSKASDELLIHEVLEAFYKTTYINRAETEAFQAMDDRINKAMQEITALKEQALTEIKAEVDKNHEMVKMATSIINQLVVQEDTDEEDEETVEESESPQEEKPQKVESEMKEQNEEDKTLEIEEHVENEVKEHVEESNHEDSQH